MAAFEFLWGQLYLYDGKPVFITSHGPHRWVLSKNDQDDSTVTFCYVNSNGSLGPETHKATWGFKKTAKPLNFGSFKIVVELPPDVQQQLAEEEKLKARDKTPDKMTDWDASHPSYGVIVLGRPTGSKKLFGSPFNHQSFMSIEIKRARKVRRFHETEITEDYGREGRHILSIAMSEHQFARFICNPGVAGGVPCTIEQVGYQSMPEPPLDEKDDIHLQTSIDVEKGAEKVKEILTKSLQDLEAMFESKKAIGVNDKKRILDAFRSAIQQVESNLPFVVTQFQEAVDKLAMAAKHEVDATIQNAIHRMGLKGLQDDSLQLLLGPSTKSGSGEK